MTIRECPVHGAPLVIVPGSPVSRCPNCHYMSHHLHFDHCPECGRRLQVEQPEPLEQCPICEEFDPEHPAVPAHSRAPRV